MCVQGRRLPVDLSVTDRQAGVTLVVVRNSAQGPPPHTRAVLLLGCMFPDATQGTEGWAGAYWCPLQTPWSPACWRPPVGTAPQVWPPLPCLCRPAVCPLVLQPVTPGSSLDRAGLPTAPRGSKRTQDPEPPFPMSNRSSPMVGTCPLSVTCDTVALQTESLFFFKLVFEKQIFNFI